MVKPAKLYAQLLVSRQRGVAFRDLVGLAQAFGFVLKRTSGSHQCWRHPQVPELLVIQPLGNQAKDYQVKLLLDMISSYGLSMDA